jgi:serine/threonine protein kinase
MKHGYTLISLLADGGANEVWRAQAPNGCHVALRVSKGLLDNDAIESELRGLALIRSMRHPYLLHILAYWVADKRLYVLMELVDESLLDRAAEYRRTRLAFPIRELLAYLWQTADILDHLHSSKLAHGSVKAGHILLLNGQVKLTGLESIRVAHNNEELTPPAVSALACVYTQLRLDKPGDAESKDVTPSRDNVDLLADGFSLPLLERDVVVRALQGEPRLRFATCAEFVQALRRACGA